MANTAPELDNQAVADKLDEVASLLEVQGASRFRVEAYRSGAATVRRLSRSVAEIVEEDGLDGLEALPAIGETLARAIRTMVRVGSLPQLERLRGETDPEALFSTIPGIGPALAERIHDELHLDSIEDLEAAAYDGRLASTPGFGAKRLEGIRAALSARLRRVRRSSARTSEAPSDPSVAEILDVDREYREKARRGELPTIAPRRMNPDGEAWLPVLHTARGERSYTALFSNTPLAHKLGRTDDWVVVYPENGASGRPFTVVTERRGALAGRRVVRGREEACRELYGTPGAA